MYSFIYLWYGWIVVVRSPENSCYQLLSYGHLGMIHRRILRRFWSQQSMESAMLYVTCTRLGCCSPKITPSRSCCGWATWSSAVVWSHRFHGSRGPVSRNPHNHPESPYEDTDQVKNVHRKNTARIIRGAYEPTKKVLPTGDQHGMCSWITGGFRTDNMWTWPQQRSGYLNSQRCGHSYRHLYIYI